MIEMTGQIRQVICKLDSRDFNFRNDPRSEKFLKAFDIADLTFDSFKFGTLSHHQSRWEEHTISEFLLGQFSWTRVKRLKMANEKCQIRYVR